MFAAKFAVLALLSTVFLPAAFADIVTVYYTGNDFTSPQAPFTTSDFITGQITYDTSQVDSGMVSTFDSWGFGVDGNNSIFTNQNLDAGSDGNFFQVSVDQNGNVDDWAIIVGRIIGGLMTTDDPSFGTTDAVFIDGTSSNTDDAGTWSTIAPGTPEPATALLLPLGLGGLYLIHRRGGRNGRSSNPSHSPLVHIAFAQPPHE